MFSKKTEKVDDGTQKTENPTDGPEDLAPPLKPFSKKGSHVPNKPPVPSNFQLETPTRQTEIPRGPDRHFKNNRKADIDSKKLIVGRAIELRGEITSCDHLIVEGYVEISLPGGRILEISDTGKFKGTAEIEVADISGRFDGDLTARDRLIIRSTGIITGSVRYGRIVIESGGQVAGDMKTLDPTALDTAKDQLPENKADSKKLTSAKKGTN